MEQGILDSLNLHACPEGGEEHSLRILSVRGHRWCRRWLHIQAHSGHTNWTQKKKKNYEIRREYCELSKHIIYMSEILKQ